jgi:hypothetical protein
VTYTAATGFVGTATFTYQAFDGLAYSAVTTVTVTVTDRAPVAVNDSSSTTKGTAVTVTILSNDTDPDLDPLTITGLVQPLNGTVVINSNGTVTYTPKKGFTGTDTFTYKDSDGLLTSNTATVTIKVG